MPCCPVCSGTTVAETAEVRSNVRAHKDERFALWRCGACRSIHARDEVDLERYYRDYPFFRQGDSWVTRHFLRRLWRRVARAGVHKDDAILDYGCGGGALVELLRRRGYARATGYDAYAARWADPRALEATYEVVVAQDVIEHVADPIGLLATFDRLCRPGGVIAIGTPDAAALDLAEPARHVHSLHQPYHRHILASPALIRAGQARGWTLVRYHRRPYTNSWLPSLNQPYLLRYLRAFDDTLDVAFDPPRLSWRMLTPGALFDFALGALRCEPTDGMAVFRKPR